MVNSNLNVITTHHLEQQAKRQSFSTGFRDEAEAECVNRRGRLTATTIQPGSTPTH